MVTIFFDIWYIKRLKILKFLPYLILVTHWGLSSVKACHLIMTQSSFLKWLVNSLVPSHHLKQYKLITNGTIRNKLKGNINQNKLLFNIKHLKKFSANFSHSTEGLMLTHVIQVMQKCIHELCYTLFRKLLVSCLITNLWLSQSWFVSSCTPIKNTNLI